ncbi:endothelin-converting enzyme [Candidatus Koribacter versatilis Ellin345]|uniref:Endothelin-converting enzyme n=1 Tax=Koribacter versatilis (strain Ellin345) TaxID=204669 RepID=Q1IHY5_KORVE|nr:M13 family metallopeptidase [Candidatus Koribacter versatilis]ABF43515.1 endothelin-converting enzyme [Candidatus Koribacter versatilis Ellin345]
MKKFLSVATSAVLAVSMGFAQKPANDQQAEKTAAKKGTKGFDINALDRSTDPCTDFYQFACGSWIKNNPIPSDQARWGRFSELLERNQMILRDILEKQRAANANRDAIDQKIGDYYDACMDEKGIDAKGLDPLKSTLDSIAAVKDKSELPALLGKLHRTGLEPLFGFGPEPDFKNAKMMGASVDQGGLGLPEKDYYSRDDAKSVELRKAYVEHITNMFKLAGESADQAAKDAQTVMTFETTLAKNSMSVVERRDVQKLYNPKTKAEFIALTPAFDWNKYLVALDAPSFEKINLDSPNYIAKLNEVVQSNSLDDIKTYLRWQTLHGAARALPTPFVNENFSFYGKTLTGAKEIRPRWKRCVQFTDNQLGEALGQAYVKVAFPPDAKDRMEKMVHNLEASMKTDIEGLDWMTAETKKAAIVKLSMINDKIGYPDKWRDYSRYNVVRGDFLGNTMRGNEFETQRQLDKINKPVDRTEWGMTPPTVNAYYNPQENNINFPAGILQPPFFDNKLDDGVNYGAIGAVIGHEMTHGFDDEGREFDGSGDLRNWWTEADGKAFEQRAQCLVDEYDSFIATDDVHVRGKLTLGENTADNGGLRVALMALESTFNGKEPAKIDGFTAQQRAFLGFAQVWCENQTPQALRVQAQTNPHSPGKWRTNGVMRNMPEFRKAFGCKEDAPMAPTNACRVW